VRWGGEGVGWDGRWEVGWSGGDGGGGGVAK